MKRETWFDETDAALADAAQRYARERHAFEAKQRLAPAQRRFRTEEWREMADLGWLGGKSVV